MLKSIYIKNYALIQSCHIEFSTSLNVITGQTGAGKSIIFDALKLIFGNRFDTNILFNQDEKCIVEGVFDLNPYKLKNLFDEENIEFDQECIIRRELSANNKSRSFVNDSPVNLSFLKKLSNYLVDIHSQEDTYILTDANYPLEILDYYTNDNTLKKNYQNTYKHYVAVKAEIETLQKKISSQQEDQNYKNFILEELNEFDLTKINYNTLTTNVKKIENLETINTKIAEVINIFDNSNSLSLNNSIGQIIHAFKQINHLVNSQYESIQSRFENIHLEVKDLYNEILNIQPSLDIDPSTLQQQKTILDKINNIIKKNNLTTFEQLLSLKSDLENTLNSNDIIINNIKNLQISLHKIEENLYKIGDELSLIRIKSSEKFSKAVEEKLKKIGIKEGVFFISFEKNDHKVPYPNGFDKIKILFSANKGLEAKDIKNVASGGEFSRVLFAVKASIAEKTNLPTLIFDEIDTGISGEVAIQMMHLMKKISENSQIICISHSPLIASGASKHFNVFKATKNNYTESKIEELNNDQRIIEIAKMIGGENYPIEAELSAKKLLQL